MPQPLPVPLPLAVRCASPSVDDAIAVALEVAQALRRAARGADATLLAPGIADVRLQADGGVTWTLGEAVDSRGATRRVAQLLARMIDAAGGEARAAAAVRYALARATDDRALAPLDGLDELVAVLERFAPPNRRRAIAALARRAAAADVARTLTPASTIADLRRTRRARGITLGAIAVQTGIPVSLLRELEWGLFANWSTWPSAERWVRAYARAAGLDPDVVVAIVAPHIGFETTALATVASAVPLLPSPRHGTRRALRYLGTLLLIVALAGFAAWRARHVSSPTISRPATVEVMQPSEKPAAPAPPPPAERKKPATRRVARVHQRSLEAPTPRRGGGLDDKPLLIIRFGDSR